MPDRDERRFTGPDARKGSFSRQPDDEPAIPSKPVGSAASGRWRLRLLLFIGLGGLFVCGQRAMDLYLAYQAKTAATEAGRAAPQANQAFQDDEARLVLQGQRAASPAPQTGAAPATGPRLPNAAVPRLNVSTSEDWRSCLAQKHRHPQMLAMSDRALPPGACTRSGVAGDPAPSPHGAVE